MTRPSLFRIALLAALGAAVPFAPACSSDAAPAAQASIADVLREGDVNETQLRAVLANEAEDWAWAGGQFDTPEDGATLAASAPYEFTWHADSTEPADGGAPSDTQMVHLLVFSSPSHGTLLRLFTTLDSYTPDADTWQQLVAAGEPITLSLTSATFAGDELTVDGGPYVGQALTFSIE